MMRRFEFFVLSVAWAIGAFAEASDVIVENADFRLICGTNAIVKSLVVKETGEECAEAALGLSLFSVTQDRPFMNEIKLIHPNKRTTWPATGLRREGNRLIASFEHRQYEAVVSLRIAPNYIGFTLESFNCDRKTTYDYLRMDIPPVSSFRVLQLPIANRKNFGDWLNASWDEKAAVGVVGTSVYPDIDHEDRQNAKILFGEVFSGRRLRGAGAALIAAPGREAFLDAMDAIEVDYVLPRGVANRRRPEAGEFIFHLTDFRPENLDEVIDYAKRGGFKLITFNQRNFTKELDSWGSMGNYDLQTDVYTNGLADITNLLRRVHAAGLRAGLHTFHPHIGMKSRYVTPVADPRLNKTRRFTLAEPLPLGTNDLAEVRVWEPTDDTVMFEPCRTLQFGGELLSYESYSTEPPYRFFGVKRGAWGTRPAAHPRGEIGGVLDISEFGDPKSCYIDQDTDLQDEVAEKIAQIYNCGFDYIYLDGSEGVNRPFNYNIGRSQHRVWRLLRSEPILAEGAAKVHFGWHMLSGANAFDCFTARIFKEKLREFPFKQAPLTWQDMTRVDFGWWGFWAPGSMDWWERTIGIQADMFEYGVSVATAWDCAASVLFWLDELHKHPRTGDILETMRRWAEVRRKGLMKDSWRKELKCDYQREHHLLKCADGGYDLVRYEMICDGYGKLNATPIRAFAFAKGGSHWVVFWHVNGSGVFKLPIRPNEIAVYDEFEGRSIPVRMDGERAIIPVANRAYLKSSLPMNELVRVFQNASEVKSEGIGGNNKETTK